MNIDLTPVWQAGIGLLATVLSVVGPIVLLALAKKFNIQVSTQQVNSFDQALEKSINFAAMASLDQIRAVGWDHVTVKGNVLSLAAYYLATKFPDTLKAVKLDPKDTKGVLDALTRAYPAAMANAAASPATPPENSHV